MTPHPSQTVLIDEQSEPGAYLDMMAHSPCLRVESYAPGEGSTRQAS